MSNEERKKKFELIRKPRRVPASEEQFVESASQSLLFPMPRHDLLIFVVFPLVNEEDFTGPLEFGRPSAILELRRSPRFDVGRLNRQLAFQWFEATHSRYYDLSPMLSSSDSSSADPVELVATFLKNSRNHINGPVMILLSHAHAAEGDNDIVGEITRLFASASDHSWKTITFPQFA